MWQVGFCCFFNQGVGLQSVNTPIPLIPWIHWEQEIKSAVPLFKTNKQQQQQKNPQSKRREVWRDGMPTVNKSIFLSG